MSTLLLLLLLPSKVTQKLFTIKFHMSPLMQSNRSFQLAHVQERDLSHIAVQNPSNISRLCGRCNLVVNTGIGTPLT